MVLKQGIAALAIGGMVWAGAMAPTAATAQGTPDEAFGFFDFGPPQPLNVPDERGCIKQCIEDLTPCDPPLFKHADGRCVQKFNSGHRR